MNYTVCLDPSNFDLTNLSPNGFSVYTDLDNFTSPVAQNIPASLLFPPPTGTCPYTISGIPSGSTQILIIDQCEGAGVGTKGTDAPPSNPAPTTNCCYALIDLPSTPPTTSSFCTTCSLDFDVFSSSYVGQIVAGDLTSTCGSVTDYIIGWYLDGDYSAPVFTSGKGTTFLPYQHTHPLTSSASPLVPAGNWEGIIHDIAINGTVYSSVSGSANGQLIPFESCFGTFVIDPLTCDNGPYSGSSKYSHQFNFNGLAAGITPPPVSFTYTLSPTIKYFAFAFQGFSVWDEIEIKWNSGDPAATTNPTLYSQSIYLEKTKVGLDAAPNFLSPNNLPVATNGTTFNPFIPPTIAGFNDIWPKTNASYEIWQKVLTLTNLETSSNPAAPDSLTITITPNPSNSNTNWIAGFQCLEDFDCTDCVFDDYPDSLPKINEIKLIKQYGCDAQRIELNTTGCLVNSDWMGINPNVNSGQFPFFGINQQNLNLIGSYKQTYQNYNASIYAPLWLGGNIPFLPLTGTTTCSPSTIGTYSACGPSSTGTITHDITSAQIQITFNLESDYLFYKNNLLAAASQIGISTTTPPIACTPLNSGNNPYYTTFGLKFPIQATSAQCGDGTIFSGIKEFNSNDYYNIIYTETPSSNFWQITIPRTSLTNCNTLTAACSNCSSVINNFITLYNGQLTQPPISFTTTTGAKYSNPFQATTINASTGNSASGSVCIDSNIYFQSYYWYSVNTIPFISSPTSPTGWVNLPTLGASLPCDTTPYPLTFINGNGLGYNSLLNKYQIRFPNLTSSFNYSLSTNDFEIYALAGFGATGSAQYTTNAFPLPCPDPTGSLIYSYIGGVATVYTSSYFVGGNPTLIIDP